MRALGYCRCRIVGLVLLRIQCFERLCLDKPRSLKYSIACCSCCHGHCLCRFLPSPFRQLHLFPVLFNCNGGCNVNSASDLHLGFDDLRTSSAFKCSLVITQTAVLMFLMNWAVVRCPQLIPTAYPSSPPQMATGRFFPMCGYGSSAGYLGDLGLLFRMVMITT